MTECGYGSLMARSQLVVVPDAVHSKYPMRNPQEYESYGGY